MSARMLVGLIGSNIGGSLSPALHEDAFAAAGMVGHYHLMDVSVLPGRSLADLLAAARMAGFAGVNVTFPFKEAVLPLLDSLAPEAAEIGAVNTVVFDENGKTTGHNTDRSGFRAAFQEELGEASVHGKSVLLLGAGGAGRAAAFALKDMGAGLIRIHDQDTARADGLCGDLARNCTVSSDTDGVAGIVNATPVGMKGYPGMPMDPRQVRPEQFVADVIYTPLNTELVLAARRKGCRTMNGRAMCVHQAADAFRHFTGRVADVARMKRTFDVACARRDALT
jgi:quinate/shikimate dehydrogenase (NAD+)